MANFTTPQSLAGSTSRPFLGQTRVFQQTVSLRRQQASHVVAMAKPTKAAELRNLSNEEIEKEIYACQRSLLKLRWAKAGRKPFEPDQFGWNKNKIAQLKTILREREIEQGVSRRDSRRKEKEQKIALGFGQF